MQISDLAYIDSTGYHYADYPTFLDYVKQKYRDIFGADVYLEDDSQDGQFLAVIAQGFYDQAALGAAVYNSFSPSSAQGTGLSRVVKINGIARRDATNSTVTVSIGGTYGTVITNGVVQDTLGQKWNLPASVTIPIGGTIDVTATAQDEGAINAGIATITKIFTPTQGWQTVTNAAAATPGVAVETDAELRSRQTQSTSIPSLSIFEGTVGAVQNVSGVTSAVGYENSTGSTDSNSIPAHSICMVVQGGLDADVAQTIADKKGPGCGTYGTTSVTVYDSHGMPMVIKFLRPTVVTIGVRLTIATFQGWSPDYATAIKAAVSAYINSLGIGAIPTTGSVLISKIYIPAYLPDVDGAAKSFNVALVELSKNGGAYGTSNVAIAFNEKPNTAVTDVVII